MAWPCRPWGCGAVHAVRAAEAGPCRAGPQGGGGGHGPQGGDCPVGRGRCRSCRPCCSRWASRCWTAGRGRRPRPRQGMALQAKGGAGHAVRVADAGPRGAGLLGGVPLGRDGGPVGGEGTAFGQGEGPAVPSVLPCRRRLASMCWTAGGGIVVHSAGRGRPCVTGEGPPVPSVPSVPPTLGLAVLDRWEGWRPRRQVCEGQRCSLCMFHLCFSTFVKAHFLFAFILHFPKLPRLSLAVSRWVIIVLSLHHILCGIHDDFFRIAADMVGGRAPLIMV